VIFNLSLNYYLVPRYNALGGAITSLATQTGLALVFFVVATRSLKLEVNVRWLLAHLGFAILAAAICYGIVLLLPGMSHPVQLAIFGIIGLVLIFVFRFVSVQNLRQLAGRKLETA
jgi:O-antigen/teichoic acid export membrane protein